MIKEYYKIGYIWDKYLDKATCEDMKILTHINIAFGLVENGKIKTSHLKNIEYISKLREYNPDIKILLSVGGWGAGGFSNAAITPEGQIKFAESGYDAYKNLGLDGIDIDWEYPCSDSAGIDASPEDKYNFTGMLKNLREALPKPAMLTIAAGAGEYFINGTEMQKVQEYLDYVQLMTYDMCWGEITAHHTNLYLTNPDDKKDCVESSVDLFNKAGVPLDKIIIGIAFYSRKWDGANIKDNNGFNQKTGKNAGFGPGYTELRENYINKNGYIKYWDDNAKAPYLFNEKSGVFISYDDEDSVKYKCGYVKKSGVKGIMYWEHSCDPGKYLLNAIKENL